MDESLLLNRYRVLETLGEGATSKVVKAFDTRMERPVAIKIIPAGKHTAQRALREARTAALLNHPNIVTVYEFEQDENNFYLIMEYVTGTTLEDLVDKFGPLPQEVVAAIGIQVCAGLEAAHLNDIVHRDVKPANIMVMPDGRARVMDFGISRLSWIPITREGTIVGTFAYMSPEQAKGDLVDERSDIFSLGVVLYELLTGVNPFSAQSPRTAAFRIQNSDPPEPHQLSKEVDEGFSKVVMKALAKLPEERYDMPTDFRYKLERHRKLARNPEDIVKEFLADPRPSADQPGPLTYISRSWNELLGRFPKLTSLASGALLAGAWLVIAKNQAGPLGLPPLAIPAAIIACAFVGHSLSSLAFAIALGLRALEWGGFWGPSVLALALGSWWALARNDPAAGLSILAGPAAISLGVPFAAPLLAGLSATVYGAAATAVASFSLARMALNPTLPAAGFSRPFPVALELGLWAAAAVTVALVRARSGRLLVLSFLLGDALLLWSHRVTSELLMSTESLPSLLQTAMLSFIIALAVAGVVAPSAGNTTRSKVRNSVL